jgi:hypothetical protein
LKSRRKYLWVCAGCLVFNNKLQVWFLSCYWAWAGMAQSILLYATSLTVRRSNPGGDEIFRTRPDRPEGPPSLLHNGYGSFSGVKWLGGGVAHTPPSKAEVKERVELSICSSSGPSWFVSGFAFYCY